MPRPVCRVCEGRGFHWQQSHLISRVDGKIIADMKKRGDTCEECGGDGISRELSGLGWAGIIGLAIGAAVLYMIPAVPV